MMDTNATETWQACMIALDCGDLHGAEGVDEAIKDDSAVVGIRSLLVAYAESMRNAVAFRALGAIPDAIEHEMAANRTYRSIPKAWRW